VGGAALLTVGIIAAPVIIVGSIYAFNAEARQDLARGVDYVLSGGEGYVWEDAPPAQVAVPDVCTHTVDDILVMAKGQTSGSDEKKLSSLDDYPANPDEWAVPEGWVETPASEKTGGKHRQWRGPKGEWRRWDREGRSGGKERGPHWHDWRTPGNILNQPDKSI
jgi:hypothetical protein